MKKDQPLSAEATAFVAKHYPCEPPCDSYGVCSNCTDSATFHVGYNHGFRAAREKIQSAGLFALGFMIGKSGTEEPAVISLAKALKELGCESTYVECIVKSAERIAPDTRAEQGITKF